jgi:hypothetical protein
MKIILHRNAPMGILILLVAAWVFAGCATAPPETRGPAVRSRQSVRTFDIRAASTELVGKTPEAIVRLLGRPDRMFGNEHWEWWTYENEFHDSITGKVLGSVTLVFHNGRLVDVTF